MSGHELTCHEVVEVVTHYLDGALDPGDRARFDEHLRDCEGVSRGGSAVADAVERLHRATLRRSG